MPCTLCGQMASEASRLTCEREIETEVGMSHKERMPIDVTWFVIRILVVLAIAATAAVVFGWGGKP